VSCPTDCFALDGFAVKAGVRLRPVPEWGACLAYTPAHPALHRLNAASWLIASLCDGRSFPAIAAAYREALGGGDAPTVSETTLRAGLEQLLELGIVGATPPAPETPSAGGDP
jgi:hypothetical protein